MQQLVSIIIPLYNRVSLIKETIDSIKNQTITNWECVIVDDYSTDGSFETALVIAEQDDRMKIYKRKGGMKGAPACRNQGLEACSGSYVIFLDSDDLMSPNCLEQRLAFINQYPVIDFLAFPVMLFNKHPEDLKLLFNIKTEEPDLDRFIRRDQVWQTSGPIWKKDFLLKLGGFDESLPSQQDYDLHIRALLEKPNYQYIETTPDIYYRQVTSGHFGKKSQSPEHLIARAEMLNKLIHLTSIKGQMTDLRKKYYAQYLLDLASMWRWHKDKIDRDTYKIAKEVWKISRDQNLVTEPIFAKGNRYLCLNHKFWLRKMGFIYKIMLNKTEAAIKEYIHRKSETLGKVKCSEVLGDT